MTDAECVEFLQWALPRLGLRWPGFRKVRRQVCKRVARRMRALELPDANAYRQRLEATLSEWAELDAMCWISISRFYRDRAAFDALERVVLPEVAQRARERGSGRLRAWCAGCAAGEEAYTLGLAWELGVRPEDRAPPLDVLGTDVDEHQLERARRAIYPASSLKDLPAPWRSRAFERTPGGERLRDRYRRGVRFERQDLRVQMPDGPFDLVLCRNFVFTYLTEAQQGRLGWQLVQRLVPGGALVVGAHEGLPDRIGASPWRGCPSVYRSAGRHPVQGPDSC